MSYRLARVAFVFGLAAQGLTATSAGAAAAPPAPPPGTRSASHSAPFSAPPGAASGHHIPMGLLQTLLSTAHGRAILRSGLDAATLQSLERDYGTSAPKGKPAITWGSPPTAPHNVARPARIARPSWTLPRVARISVAPGANFSRASALTLSGAGFHPGQVLTVSLVSPSGQPRVLAHAGSDGTSHIVPLPVYLPANAPLGADTLTVRDETGRAASAVARIGRVARPLAPHRRANELSQTLALSRGAGAASAPFVAQPLQPFMPPAVDVASASRFAPVVFHAALAPRISAAPAGIVVSTGGTDNGSCGSSASPCRTIQYAIGRAGSGGTVSVQAGTYNEHVSINSNLTLRGAGAGGTIIDGGSTGPHVVAILGGNVTISGITIQHGVGQNGGGVYNAATLTLSNSTVQGNNATGTAGGAGRVRRRHGAASIVRQTLCRRAAPAPVEGDASG